MLFNNLDENHKMNSAASSTNRAQPSDSNPFIEAVSELVQSIRRIQEVFASQDKNTRVELLSEALRNASRGMQEHVSIWLISHYLLPAPGHEMKPTSVQQNGRSKPEPSPRTKSEAQLMAALRLIHIIVPLFLQLLQMPYAFKMGYLNARIPKNKMPWFFNDPRQVIDILLNKARHKSQRKELAKILKTAAMQVTAHERGMFVGYNAVAKQALQLSLRELDPESLHDEEPNKWTSYFVAPKTLDDLRQNVEQIKNTDWNIIEKRVYRPAFIYAYKRAAKGPVRSRPRHKGI